MKKFNFSVIIPVLNEEKYIESILTSLEDQTYKNFKVIIVNNGCTDNTVRIIRNYIKNSNLKIILVFCRQRGISYARNFGSKFARGEYLVFFDADGIVHKDWLKIAKFYLDKYSELQVLGGIDIFRSPRGLLASIYYNLHCVIGFSTIYLIQIILGNAQHICGHNIAIKKDLFKQTGGFPHIVAEDIALTRKLIKILKGRNKILLKHNLIVHYSTRKFEKMGYVKTLWEQIRGYKKKTNSKDYKIARE